jgi:hypothetical protein
MNVTSVSPKWIITIQPEEFQLFTSPIETIPTDENANYIWLPNKKAYVKTFPVRVFMKVPRSAEGGNYTVVISAFSYSEKKGTLTVIQSRSFKFLIEVEGKERLAKIISKGKVFLSEVSRKVTEFVATNPDISIIWSIVGFVILTLWIIDKKLG